MKKIFFIIAHKNPVQVSSLINQLSDGNSIFYVHVDKKCDYSEWSFLLKNINVSFISPRIDCAWGDKSIVHAMLSGFRQIILNEACGFVFLLSGQCWPLMNNAEVDQFLERNKFDLYMDIRPVSEVWSSREVFDRINSYRFNLSAVRNDALIIAPILSRNFFDSLRKLFIIFRRKGLVVLLGVLKGLAKRPKEIRKFYGGSQWFAIDLAALKKIMVESERDEYKNYLDGAHCPDEIFFQTIAAGLIKEKKINSSGTITYVNWFEAKFGSPKVFSEKSNDELRSAKNNGFIFARKFEC